MTPTLPRPVEDHTFFKAYRASLTGENMGVWQGLVVSLYRHRDGHFDAQMRAFGDGTAPGYDAAMCDAAIKVFRGVNEHFPVRPPARIGGQWVDGQWVDEGGRAAEACRPVLDALIAGAPARELPVSPQDDGAANDSSCGTDTPALYSLDIYVLGLVNPYALYLLFKRALLEPRWSDWLRGVELWCGLYGKVFEAAVADARPEYAFESSDYSVWCLSHYVSCVGDPFLTAEFVRLCDKYPERGACPNWLTSSN